MRREELVIERWRLTRQPLFLGKNFLIVTSWQFQLARAAHPEKMILVVDPGPACRPDHPTITLSMQLLEQYWRGGRMLDAGSGSTIVTMAAARLATNNHYSFEIEAFDEDIDLIDYLQETIAINNLTEAIALKFDQLMSYDRGDYALIHANLLSINNSTNLIASQKDRLSQLLINLKDCLLDDGLMILTGIAIGSPSTIKSCWGWWENIWETITDNWFLQAITEVCLEIVAIETKDNWQAVVVKKR